MSARPTNEIVAELRDWASPITPDPPNAIFAVMRAAADRLDELDAALDAQIKIGVDLAVVAFQVELDTLRAQVAAVEAALVIPQPNSQGATLYESGYADALFAVKKALEG